jgi:hypothetical protein
MYYHKYTSVFVQSIRYSCQYLINFFWIDLRKILQHQRGSFEKCKKMQHNSRKKHDLLNNKEENNTVIKRLTYTINPST